MKESVVRNAVKGLIGCLSIIMSVAASAGPLSFIFGDDEPKMEYFKNLPDCSDLKGHKSFTTKKAEPSPQNICNIKKHVNRSNELQGTRGNHFFIVVRGDNGDTRLVTLPLGHFAGDLEGGKEKLKDRIKDAVQQIAIREAACKTQKCDS